MAKEDAGTEIVEDHGPQTPVCLRCLRPVEPTAHYCPNCGEATGQLTPYIPFINIPWQTRIWGQMWRQVWSGDVSIPGRLFRLFMVIWGAPVLLIGLFFRRREPVEEPDAEEPEPPWNV